LVINKNYHLCYIIYMPTANRKMRDSGTYHVTNRGNNKKYIFCDRVDKEVFVRRLFLLQTIYKFKIITFSIMDNHFHLLVKDKGRMLPVYIGALEDYYAKYFNKKSKHQGHVFQGPFKSYLVKGYMDLLKNFRYIARNAVAACIAKSVFTYEWTVVDRNSRFHEFIDYGFIEEALEKTGNKDLKSYIEENVDDLWAHEIEREIRIDSEAEEIYQEYLKKAGLPGDIEFYLLEIEDKKRTIRFLLNMGLSKKQITWLTGLSRYRINNLVGT